ncbi:MAG: hypothetical protein KTR31_10080 [Myxococcales bacterium]|nr:hypothetical protein [Myxococcales bacterium]
MTPRTGIMAVGMALLAGCSGDGLGPIDAATGSLNIAIAAEAPQVTDDEGLRLVSLQLQVDALVIDGVAPSMAESVEVLVDAAFEPLESVDAIPVTLETGRHTDFTFEMRLDHVEQPSILAVAAKGDDGEQIILAVDRMALAFTTPLVQISEVSPRMASVVFDPETWFAGISADDDGPTVVDATSGPAYDALLARITASTRFLLEGEPIDPTPPDDTGIGDDDDDDDDDDDGNTG